MGMSMPAVESTSSSEDAWREQEMEELHRARPCVAICEEGEDKETARRRRRRRNGGGRREDPRAREASDERRPPR